MSTDVLEFPTQWQEAQSISEADKKLFVTFHKEAVKNEGKSIEAGRPIFDEYDHITIIEPGSRDSFVAKVKPGSEYPQRFPQQWARYKANQDQGVSGTPLSQVPWMSLAQIAEFNAVGCKTVEQLVGMPDNISQKFMGHHALKQRAQAYLAAAKDAAPALMLQAELEKRDQEISELRAMVEAMLAAKKAEQESKAPPKG